MENQGIIYKLHKAKKAIGVVSKNSKNPHFKNTYADINALIGEVEPILIENGLLLLQPIREGKQYTEIHDPETGEKVESYLDLNTTLPPQALGSAITYFRRYTLQSLLSLRADDNDANNASEKPKQEEKPLFTQDKFKVAYDNNATIEQIEKKYTLIPEIKQAWIDYVIENDSKKQN